MVSAVPTSSRYRVLAELAYIRASRNDNEPDKSTELLLVALDVAMQLLFDAADGGNGILKGILPRLQALGLWRVRCHCGGEAVAWLTTS
jgi:hypothetical protein